jgi:hypothetical protein
MDWIAVQFDEVMGEACAERATAWTGQRRESDDQAVEESDSMDWTAVEFDEVIGSFC